MPRKPTQVSNTSILLLKQFVQKKANLNCQSFADIQQLQFKIRKSIDEYLSVQTLNRFFGLIKNDFKPSAVTLNILARYINYNSFEEFELLQAEAKEKDTESSATVMLLNSLFSTMEYNGKIESGVLSIVRNLHFLMQKHTSLAKDVYPFMASSQFGRKYFYEQFVHIDSLNKSYGDGLNYFLIHCKDKESCFFAYNVLCLRYFLSERQQQQQHYYKKVSAYALEEIKEFNTTNIARYYATLVLNELHFANIDETVKEALRLFKETRINNLRASVWLQPEMILAEALLLRDEHELAWGVLEEGKRCFNAIGDTIPNEIKTQYDLMHLYASYYAGKISTGKAATELLSLQAKPVSFMSKDYYALLLNNLYNDVLPKSFGKLTDQQIELLIKKTGFFFFDKKLQLCFSRKII